MLTSIRLFFGGNDKTLLSRHYLTSTATIKMRLQVGRVWLDSSVDDSTSVSQGAVLHCRWGFGFCTSNQDGWTTRARRSLRPRSSGTGAGRARTAHCVLQTTRRVQRRRPVSRTGTKRPAAEEKEGGCSVDTSTGACSCCRTGTLIGDGPVSCHCAKHILIISMFKGNFYFIYL